MSSGESINNIRIDPYIFNTYGVASNWFDRTMLSFPGLDDTIFYSTDSWNIDPWPSNEQLDLIKYKKYFDYNDKTNNYISSNMLDVVGAVGIHFRGTDHYHTDRVDVQRYIDEARTRMSVLGVDKLFVATDEEGILEAIQSSIPDAQILFNQTIKSSGNVSVFAKSMSDEEKIRSGFEVLLDSHSLAKCSIVIGKLSNVNYYARILNQQLEVIYLDKGSVVR